MVENKQGEALKQFNAFLQEYPRDRDAAYAQFMVGEALLVLKENSKAIVAFGATIENHPRSKWAAMAQNRQKQITSKVIGELHILDMPE